MTTHQLRSAAIWVSLALTAGTLLFFILAPTIGLPLDFGESWKIAQISLPVFLGYLGLATQFATRPPEGSRRPKPAPPFLGILLFGPMGIYVAAVCALVGSFAWSNRPSALEGGISVEQLSTVFTALVGLLAVTTNAVVGILFRVEQS